jgi:hypothetical protein
MAGQGLSIAATKLASLSLAAKAGVGLTVATASVAGAGAAGVLPDAANARARAAIEAVTPVSFDDPADGHGQPADAGDQGQPAGDHDDNFGGVVSADATGESDGQPGVDGSEISSMAPGAAHRPADPGQAPADAGPSGATGLDRAGDTPAAGNAPTDAGAGAPDGTPSTPDTDTNTGAPAAVPSTVPAAGGPAAGDHPGTD